MNSRRLNEFPPKLLLAGLILRERVSSVIWQELGLDVLLLHIERSHLRWYGHLFICPPVAS